MSVEYVIMACLVVVIVLMIIGLLCFLAYGSAHNEARELAIDQDAIVKAQNGEAPSPFYLQQASRAVNRNWLQRLFWGTRPVEHTKAAELAYADYVRVNTVSTDAILHGSGVLAEPAKPLVSVGHTHDVGCQDSRT